MNIELENNLLKLSLRPELDAGELDAAVNLLMHSLLDGLNIARVGFWLWDENKQSINCHKLIDNHNNSEVENLSLQRNDFPNYFDALDQQRVILANDAHQHEATREFSSSYLAPLGISAMLDVPIRYGGKMIGIICCEHIGPVREWTLDEASFVAAIADLYARAKTAYQKAHYQRELERINGQLEELVAQRTEALEQHIEKLKQTQNKLIESEKLAALGSLVADLAHEVNTPLGVAITANSTATDQVQRAVTLFEQNTMTRTAFRTLFEEIEASHSILARNLSRAADLINNFKKTAVDQTRFELVEIDLCQYLKDTLESLRPFTRKQKVKIVFELPNKVVISTLPGAISQIITNLVVNACIHGFQQPSERNTMTFRVMPLNGQSEVKLEISDNGVGMDAKTLKRAMEPFFTTRKNAGGTGLGLSIVYNLVSKTLGGDITVSSEPNQGVTFQVVLPGKLPTRIAHQVVVRSKE